MSEDIRRICRRFDIKVAFKSGQTLRSQLSRVKDRLPTMMRSSVVYKIPCTCGKVYIGETTRRLETRVREHQNACRRGEFDKSAIAEHAWTDHHPILWDDISVLDRASRWRELLIKEALHIGLTPVETLVNRDAGLELATWLLAPYPQEDSLPTSLKATPLKLNFVLSMCKLLFSIF